MKAQRFDFGDLVSIVVPTFNRADKIGRCLESLIHQSYRNLEILVVDDASSDNTSAVVAALGDTRIRYIRHERNRGAAAARNTGINHALGDILCFHDSDDYSCFNRIEIEVRMLLGGGNRIGAVHSARINYALVSMETYGATQATVVPRPSVQVLCGDVFEETLRGNFVSIPTVAAWRAALVSAGPFDERLRNNEDWDFMIRFTRKFQVLFHPEPLYFVPSPVDAAANADRIGLTASFSAQSFVRITGKLRRQGIDPKLFSHHYLTAGRHLLNLSRPRVARAFILRSLKIQPLRRRAWVLLAGTFFPRAYGRLRNLPRQIKSPSARRR